MSIRWLYQLPATLGALCLFTATGLPAFAANVDGPGGGPRDNNGPGCNLFPASANVGTRVPLSYFGPPPAETNPSLVGPEQELKSGQLDAINGRITLPLYEGFITGTKTPVWYILTDVDDQDVHDVIPVRFPVLSADLDSLDNFSEFIERLPNDVSTGPKLGMLGFAQRQRERFDHARPAYQSR